MNDAPGVSVVWLLGGVMVQLLPLAANVALHPFTSATPGGAVHLTVQPRVVVPVFVTVTFTVKPCGHEFWIAYTAVQVLDSVGVGVGVGVGVAVAEPLGLGVGALPPPAGAGTAAIRQ